MYRYSAINYICALLYMIIHLFQILDLLTTFLDDLGKSGESAAEFLSLYQNLIKTAQWKSYLAIRGVLPHIGNLITREISHLTWLEETTLKTDLCEGDSQNLVKLHRYIFHEGLTKNEILYLRICFENVN